MDITKNAVVVDMDGVAEFDPIPQETNEEREIVERRNARGRVRWFNRSLGYGFIHEDGNTKEIFVHQSMIQMPGMRRLRNGQRVVFELCTTAAGNIIAINVLPIMEKPEALARAKDKIKNKKKTK